MKTEVITNGSGQRLGSINVFEDGSSQILDMFGSILGKSDATGTYTKSGVRVSQNNVPAFLLGMYEKF